MAESINFDKAKAQRFLDCLIHGKPIEGVRNFDDYLALAGACLFAARSHGSLPQRLQRMGAGQMALEGLPPEFLVSTDEQFIQDSNSAVEFYAHLTMLVHDKLYDKEFEPLFRGLVFTGKDGNKNLRPIQGIRKQ